MKFTQHSPLIILSFLAAPGLFAGPMQSVSGGNAAPAAIPRLFHASDQCMACHNQLTAPSGRDVSIGFNWRSSMMGNSGRDPYWMAGVRRESVDHPAATPFIEDKCTVCHLPMARTLVAAMGGQGRAFENFPVIGQGGPHSASAVDGVSCAVCHQIKDENLGTREGFTGGYVIDLATPMGERLSLGPFEVDAGRSRVMRSASEFTPRAAGHLQSAEFCANCHTLFTQALDPDGKEVGEFAEQVPYLEWKHSSFAGRRICQDCHMPVIEGETSVTGVLPNPRLDMNQHVFKGGNFVIPRMLNRHRGELGVKALPQELEATARASLENLATNAASLEVSRIAIEDGRLNVELTVVNLAGHKLPTAYPSRRVWLHVTLLDSRDRVLLESGAFRANGMIEGNDNDLDAGRFEPHYDRITSSDQVQIYEDIMVDYAGKVTTGLLSGARYIKDNRVLPDGFDKATATWDIAVNGGAKEDPDFTGGSDRIRYAVEVGEAKAPFRVVAELWYQPIGYRWAMNLGEYKTVESLRFLRFFDAAASSSRALLARAERVLR